ncbi:diguanylate cyclase [uncultured Desulfovibrio sp.]|uniref:GGDEF domain-containing protein n=1 Tax=uncultured Desulfovibrio sp. TaxID=167968 RepID=UPI00260CF4C9|nr:diguanylate cyclase [uncultured Desulfovibrio sp.]
MLGGFSRTNLPVQRYLALLVLPWGAMLLLAVAVLWPYLAWFQDTVESLQDEQLPGVLEAQRTRTNLNVLRKQLAIIYLAEAPAERRRARLQAQALLAGMGHDPSPAASAAVAMEPRVRQLYDACMAADRALSRLHRGEMELLLAVSRLEQLSGRQLAGAVIFSHTGKDGMRHGRKAFEEMRRLLAPVAALCDSAADDESAGACEAYGQRWGALSVAWEARLAANERAYVLWQELENELLRLINVISSRELQRSLEEAESLSDATDYIVWSVFVFTLGLLAFLLVLVLLLRRDLLRPLVGIAGNLSRLRDGQQPEPIAPVRIAELQEVADIVPDLGGYLGSLKEHSSRLEKEKAAYSRMSLMDSLTAIPNRRAFDLRLADLADRRRPVGLIMLDVDMFKVYNDTLGHQEGDACLRRVAQTMRDCLRGGEKEIFRYGGEEFGVVLEDVPREAALQVAERLRRAVERLALPHPGNPQTGLVTISLGVAAVTELTEDNLACLLDAADHALYAAKKNGRNRVADAAEGVCSGGEDEPAPAGAGTEKSACLAHDDRL